MRAGRDRKNCNIYREEKIMNLRVRMPRARKKMVTVVAAFSIALALAISPVMPKVYETHALVYVALSEGKTEFGVEDVTVDVSGKSLRTGVGRSGFSGKITPPTWYPAALIVRVAEGSDVAEAAQKKERLRGVSIEELKVSMRKAEATKIYTGTTQYYYLPIIMLTVRNRDGNVARDIANAWAEVVVERLGDIAHAKVAEVNRYILERLAVAKKALAESEEEFARVSGSLSPALLEADIGSKESVLAMYNAELAGARLSLAKNGHASGGSGETVVRSLADLSEGVREDIAGLNTRLSEARLQWSRSERELEARKAEYELLEQKRVQYGISLVERPELPMIVSRADVPEKPLYPKTVLMVVLAGLIAVLLTLAIFFLHRRDAAKTAP